MKKRKLTKFSTVILVLCILSLIADIVSIFLVKDVASKSRLIFMILQTVIMIVLIFLPNILNKVIHIKIPAIMEIIYVVFCFGAIILGDVLDFYARFKWWDSILHGASGVLLGILGYAIINTFNNIDGDKIKFSPLFVSIWVVCFALAVGSVWELIEYSVDGLFGLNSQQYLETTGTLDKGIPLVGHAALRDTMKDLALDLAGALIISIIGFFDLKKQKQGFATISLEHNKPENTDINKNINTNTMVENSLDNKTE
ncbi:MAG: hypothetical protein ACI35W_06670 [Anaeroplasmataceae bacterium]